MNIIEWEHLSSGTDAITGYVGDKIYLLMSYGTGEVELDWRFYNSDQWQLYREHFVLPDLETAKQWCEMHHSTGADK